jgi:hypothetical protein
MSVFKGKISDMFVKQILDWVFLGIMFSKNINGWILCCPPIVLIFSSNTCIIPDRLLPSRVCFPLYRRDKDNENYPTLKKNYEKIVHLIKNDYLCKLKICKLKIGLKNDCKFIPGFK